MANSTGPSFDASVKGSFASRDYTAKLVALLSCVNNKPVGSFDMSVSGKEKWRITSDTPGELNIEKSKLTDHVHTVFTNTMVNYETAGKKYTKCTAFFDSTEWPLPGGAMGINVTLAVYHDNKSKPVFEWDGIFQGAMEVLRDISCGELK